MKFRSLLASAVLAISTLGVSAAAQAAGYLVNIDATTPASVDLTLGTGVYTIDILSSPYSGWSFWGRSDPSCSASGTNCGAGFQNMFNMQLGSGPDTLFIKLVTGSNYGYGMYNSTADAYAAYQSGISSTTTDLNSATLFPDKITFTVSGPTVAHFRINDGPDNYGDNVSQEIVNGQPGPPAGVSLLVTAVPEPAAWALMIGGFGMAGAMLRRRRAVAAFG